MRWRQRHILISSHIFSRTMIKVKRRVAASRLLCPENSLSPLFVPASEGLCRVGRGPSVAVAVRRGAFGIGPAGPELLHETRYAISRTHLGHIPGSPFLVRSVCVCRPKCPLQCQKGQNVTRTVPYRYALPALDQGERRDTFSTVARPKHPSRPLSR